MLAGIFTACRKENNDGDTTESGGQTEIKEPAPEAELLSTWVSPGYEKVQSGETAPKNATTSIELYMAKNESESCTVSLRSDSRITGMKFVVTDLPSDVEVTVFKEFMIPIENKEYPDPLVESNLAVSVNAESTLSFLFRFTTDADTESGDHTVTIRLENKEGQLACEYKVTIHVWDFSYPDVLTTFGCGDIDEADLAKMHKVDVDSDEFEDLYKSYYDFLLDYSFNAYEIPYDVLDSRADAYMSDPRVKSFKIDHTLPDATLRQIYNKLKTNPEWLEKAFFYPFDEPLTPEHQDQFIAACQRLEKLCPDVRRVVPFYKNPDYHADPSLDQVELLSQYTDIFCPKAYCFRDANIYTSAQKEKWGSFKTRMENFKENGYDLWWYVCWEPGHPYINMYLNELGLNHRVLFWQQYFYNVDAFLFWELNHWGGVSNPWEDMATVKGLSPDVFGDGSLLYNGNYVRLDGAVASLRLDAIRDGIEDYELLILAKEHLGEEWVLARVKKITSDILNHTNSYVTFETVRAEIGNALAEKLNK